ncbi:MAG: COG1470 family protein, partial [Candidatus Sulfotelmatobacter sp.]
TTEGAPAFSTSFTMTVTMNPDFILGEPGAFPNVKVGSTGVTGPISITSQDGFSGTVSLSCPATFGANSCSISPTSISAFPATANLMINGTSFTSGSYQLMVQGSSGSSTHLLAVAFSVGDYQVAAPLALSGVPGAQVPANLTLTSTNSYSGQVNASCDATALPAAQCALSPLNPITIGSGAVVAVTASINIPNNAAPGTYNININTQDVSGTPSHALTIALTVVQDFTLGSLTPSTQSITPGQSASYNFSVLPVGASFPSSVSLSCSGAPTISLCTFTPSSVTPGNSSAAVVLQISTTASSASVSPLGWKGAASFYALWLVLPGLFLIGASAKRRSNLALSSSLAALFLGSILHLMRRSRK